MTMMIKRSACFLLVASLAACPALGHPGAVADGRATCGSEYSTAAKAYIIPDIREAWYLRRVATCESPVFWSGFDVTEEGQQIYVAVMSPEIERFEDELQFHAIWYGPGLAPDEENGLREIPDELPEGVVLDEALAAEGAGYMTHTIFDSCDFVDTNPVMKNWSDLIKGRCSEDFSFGEDFSDPLQQDASSVISWWLYSFNHNAAQKGAYRLQTWMTSRDDLTKTAQAKYEMTLGPWTWRGYASDSTLALAQNQGTSCSCAVNAWDYKETYLERLGELPMDFETAQLPGGSCSGDNQAPASSCVTIPQEPYMTDGSAVEWSGLFELEAGRTYEWTFRAYYQGFDADPEYGYPDPGMFVYMVAADNVESVAVEANTILTTTVETEEEAPSTTVVEGDTLGIDAPTFIKFTDPEEAVSTTILIEPGCITTMAIFTQHVPSEFMAHALRDAENGNYIFPKSQTLYFDAGAATTTDATQDNTQTTTMSTPGITTGASTIEGTMSTATIAGSTAFPESTATAGSTNVADGTSTTMSTPGTTTDATTADAITGAATIAGATTAQATTMTVASIVADGPSTTMSIPGMITESTTMEATTSTATIPGSTAAAATTFGATTAGTNVVDDVPCPVPNETIPSVDNVESNNDPDNSSSFVFTDISRRAVLAGIASIMILW